MRQRSQVPGATVDHLHPCSPSPNAAVLLTRTQTEPVTESVCRGMYHEGGNTSSLVLLSTGNNQTE